MPMHDPCHPGEIVKYECLEPLGLTITRAARGLGVSRQKLSELVNCKTSVSADMAIRLSLPSAHRPRLGWECNRHTTSGKSVTKTESMEVEQFAAASRS